MQMLGDPDNPWNALTAKQARRVEQRILGWSYERIGLDEKPPVSRQAVWISCQGAMKKLPHLWHWLYVKGDHRRR